MNCRHCKAILSHPVLDLGSSPPSNAYLTKAALSAPETWFPLRLLVCENCWLVQTEDHASRDQLFDCHYAYFSSFSTSWVDHAEQYVSEMVDRVGLTERSCVVEVASNDGYLLQFVRRQGIPCYGIEPTTSTAEAARFKGIETIEDFFGVGLASQLAAKGKRADLIVANNVLAHVPDINDFVAGFSCLLKPEGTATFEFPHLTKMIERHEFDTVYHEHYSYLSLTTVSAVFEANGLKVVDTEELLTHGGSLRVFARRSDTTLPVSSRVTLLLDIERTAGVSSLGYYSDFQVEAERIKNGFLTFLIEEKRRGRRVVGYGAAAKGNTLLNFAGVRPDLFAYVVDRNPAKAGKFMPGSRIPIVDETHLTQDKPDTIVVLPWNLSAEVAAQLSYTKKWNARLVVAVPGMFDL